MKSGKYFRRARKRALAGMFALLLTVADGTGTVVATNALDPPSPNPVACIDMIKQVDGLRMRDPSLAALYARPGPAERLGLPRLADPRTVALCGGDPEKILERLRIAHGSARR